MHKSALLVQSRARTDLLRFVFKNGDGQDEGWEMGARGSDVSHAQRVVFRTQWRSISYGGKIAARCKLHSKSGAHSGKR